MLSQPPTQTMRCATCHEEKPARDIHWFKPFDSAEAPGVNDSTLDMVETTSDDPHAVPRCPECGGFALDTV